MNGQLWVVLSPFIHWNKNRNEENEGEPSRTKNLGSRMAVSDLSFLESGSHRAPR